MGSGSKYSLNDSKLSEMVLANSRQSSLVTTDSSVEVQSSSSSDCSETPLNENQMKPYQYHEFISKCKNQTISVLDADVFIVENPGSLFAVDFDGKSAIQYAGGTQNVPLFHLLIRRKHELRRKYLERVQIYNTIHYGRPSPVE
jgi:hypothetical protein